MVAVCIIQHYRKIIKTFITQSGPARSHVTPHRQGGQIPQLWPHQQTVQVTRGILGKGGNRLRYTLSVFLLRAKYFFTGGKEAAEMGDLAARNIQRGRDHGARKVWFTCLLKG